MLVDTYGLLKEMRQAGLNWSDIVSSVSDTRDRKLLETRTLGTALKEETIRSIAKRIGCSVKNITLNPTGARAEVPERTERR